MTPQDLQEKILSRRGITDEAKEVFLSPSYENHLCDPFLLHDMDKAVTRILSAIEKGEKIVVYADYDADGIPGAVVMHDFLKKIGYENFSVYIPHRHTEGYGFHADAIEQFKKDGVTLVITIDVGTVAHEGISKANECGIDVIVCDHHEQIGELPKAHAVVNPKLGEYPDRMLCGAGVAFRLVQAIVKQLQAESFKLKGEISEKLTVNTLNLEALSPGWEKWLLDMVGIATLSDMVPLVGENRVLAHFGIQVLRKSRRSGLRALLRRAKVSQETLSEEDVVFSITPRLNVASRMSDPRKAFELLVTNDDREADVMAEHLAELTDKRKKETARIMKDVNKKLAAREFKDVIVVGDPGWNHGVLGLIASKICEEYHRTVFVWSADGDVIRGSCRTIGTASAVKLMEHARESLTQFGGHDGAGGFTTTRDLVHGLSGALDEAFKHNGFAHEAKIVADVFDLELEIGDVTPAHYEALSKLAPFGMGNPKPIFKFTDVYLEVVKTFGKTKEHLEIMVSQNGARKKAMTFFKTPDSYGEVLEVGQSKTLLATFDMSYWLGRPELRLRIVDIL